MLSLGPTTEVVGFRLFHVISYDAWKFARDSIECMDRVAQMVFGNRARGQRGWAA